jgi:hypothetical protein
MENPADKLDTECIFLSSEDVIANLTNAFGVSDEAVLAAWPYLASDEAKDDQFGFDKPETHQQWGVDTRDAVAIVNCAEGWFSITWDGTRLGITKFHTSPIEVVEYELVDVRVSIPMDGSPINVTTSPVSREDTPVETSAETQEESPLN